MPRFFDPQALALDTPTKLDANAAHHALRVLRMQVGDALTLFNGKGGEWQATIEAIEGKSVSIRPKYFTDDNRTSRLRVHLWLPLIKGERLDWALQKATEMGAASIQLYTSERTEVRLKAQRLEKKLEQWRRQIISACEQCGLNLPPSLAAPQPLATLWPQADASLKLIAEPTAAAFDSSQLRADNPDILLLTGPEGGFSTNEQQQAEQHGFEAFSLGERVLRAETAPVALLASLYSHA